MPLVFSFFIPRIGIYIAMAYGVYLLFKRGELLSFFILLIWARSSHPVVFPKSDLFTLIWWLAIYIPLVIFTLKNGKVFKNKFFWIALFGLCLSSIFSINPILSFFKVLNWSFILFLVLCLRDSTSTKTNLSGTFLMMFLLISLTTIPFQSVAYHRDGLGFQGILNHPQAMAVFLVVMLEITLTGHKFKSILGRYLMISLVVIFVIMTRARTGLFLLFFQFFWRILLPDLKLFSSKGKLRRSFVLSSLVIVLAGFAFLGTSGAAVQSFLRKGQNNISLTESFERSRGFIIFQQVQNFSENKYTGIGFGIARSSSHEQEVKYIAGIPLSAATEKANLPISILEEIGILGFFCLLPFFRAYFRKGSFQGLAVIFVISNLSEMTFFSYGSFGLLALVPFINYD